MKKLLAHLPDLMVLQREKYKKKKKGSCAVKITTVHSGSRVLPYAL